MKRLKTILYFIFTVFVLIVILAGTVNFLILSGTVKFNKWEDASWGIGEFPYPIHGCSDSTLCEDTDISIFGFYVNLP